MRMAPGVHQHDAVLVEQPRITLNQNSLILPIAKAQPSAAIGQNVSTLRGGGIQRRPHALAHFAIPLAAPSSGINAG